MGDADSGVPHTFLKMNGYTERVPGHVWEHGESLPPLRMSKNGVNFEVNQHALHLTTIFDTVTHEKRPPYQRHGTHRQVYQSVHGFRIQETVRFGAEQGHSDQFFE
jgi:hypothetical protein